MNDATLTRLSDELYDAMRQRTTVQALSEREPKLNLEAAYAISEKVLQRRLAEGEHLVGKKIGVTSKAVQNMLKVHQPDFGYLTDAMVYTNEDPVPISSTLIQPRAEGEIAFILKHDLMGPGVSVAQVLQATDCVMPCFEIVDSRVENWNIKIEDTVADNASCGLLVLGDQAVSPRAVDLTTCGMVIHKNGQLLSTGAGAAALGSPLNCVAWLANTLGRFGVALKAGEIILSGSLVPLEPVSAGDHMTLAIGGIGNASIRFS